MPFEVKLRAVKLIGSANAELLLAKLVVKAVSITTGLVYLLVGWLATDSSRHFLHIPLPCDWYKSAGWCTNRGEMN